MIALKTRRKLCGIGQNQARRCRRYFYVPILCIVCALPISMDQNIPWHTQWAEIFQGSSGWLLYNHSNRPPLQKPLCCDFIQRSMNKQHLKGFVERHRFQASSLQATPATTEFIPGFLIARYLHTMITPSTTSLSNFLCIHQTALRSSTDLFNAGTFKKYGVYA